MNKNMKGKYLFGGLLTALLGAAIALLAYTKIVDKPAPVSLRDSSLAQLPEAQAYLTALQTQPGQVDFTYAAEATVHAVVHVRTKSLVRQPENPIMEWFYGDRYRSAPREVAGYGSGVIISSDGYIITNNHVIEDAENIEVKLNDNRVFNAELVGRDPSTDIALLKIDAANLSFLQYGDSERLKIGEWVLAVGNPFNLTSTVTAGIVSAKGRNLNILENDYRIESFIQTDAALNMGNSGGALVDTKGLLVGITAAIYSPSGAYAGNSFAIPVSIVKKVVEDLKQYGEVQRALIGVNIQDVTSEVAEEKKLPEVKGVLITEVREGGAAADANLKKDDIIIKFNGVPVNNATELQEQVGKYRPGDRANITYIRNGKETTVPITLKNISGTTEVVARGSGSGTVFGARFETLNSSEKRMYGVDNGVKIVEVDDGLFRDLGLKRGTIITSVNNKKVNTADDVRSAAGATEKSLRAVSGITPEGREFHFQYGK